MGEEERRRKIILDSIEALNRATGCMRNTLLLARGRALTESQVEAFRSAAEDLARQADSLERHCSGKN
jgi:hypothetical protein